MLIIYLLIPIVKVGYVFIDIHVVFLLFHGQ